MMGLNNLWGEVSMPHEDRISKVMDVLALNARQSELTRYWAIQYDLAVPDKHWKVRELKSLTGRTTYLCDPAMDRNVGNITFFSSLFFRKDPRAMRMPYIGDALTMLEHLAPKRDANDIVIMPFCFVGNLFVIQRLHVVTLVLVGDQLVTVDYQAPNSILDYFYDNVLKRLCAERAWTHTSHYLSLQKDYVSCPFFMYATVAALLTGDMGFTDQRLVTFLRNTIPADPEDRYGGICLSEEMQLPQPTMIAYCADEDTQTVLAKCCG